MADELIPGAADLEAEYFYKLNKELIAKKRSELSAAPKDPVRPGNWMLCPKCGQKMAEINRSGILVDECSGCKGVYFDAGELEILIESSEPKGFLGLFKKK